MNGEEKQSDFDTTRERDDERKLADENMERIHREFAAKHGITYVQMMRATEETFED